MDRLLFTGDVVRSTGMPVQTLQQWGTTGVIDATGIGQGTGQHRTYSRMEVVAIAFAYGWRKAGLGLGLVREVFEMVAGMDEAALLTAFKEGRKLCLILPGRGCRLIAEPKGADIAEEFDLEKVYQTVMGRIKEGDRLGLKVRKGRPAGYRKTDERIIKGKLSPVSRRG